MAQTEKEKREYNERRRARIRKQSGITEEGAAPPVSELGTYGKGFIETVIPPKDFNPVHNYKPAMWELIKKHFGDDDPGIAVEVGSRRGHWAHALIEKTQTTQLFCVDPWVGRVGRQDFAVWFKRCTEIFQRCHPLQGTSLDWSRFFPYQVDLLFIDGLHDAKSVTLDLERWTPRMNKGGLIIGHDYNQPDVKAAVDKFFPDLTGTQKLGPQHAVSFWKAI